MARFWVLLLGMTLTVSGCQRKPVTDPVPGTASLMDQMAKAPEYKPPADGHLNRRQVEMYLEVHRREEKIRDTLRAKGDLANLATADLRAARELGYNPREYAWVRDRVLEAEMLRATRTLSRQVAESRQALLALLRKQKEAATDAGRKAEIDHQIRELEIPAGTANADPVRAANADLLAQAAGGSQDARR